MHIVQINNPKDLALLLRQVKVDPYGIKIMVPKGINHLIKIKAVSNITANILKQEMLSLGGEVAVSRTCLTGKKKSTDCLLMGNMSQLEQLHKKLTRQPFGLNWLASELTRTITNYQKDNFVLELGRTRLYLGARAAVMGVINLTPDSFSGDGLYLSKIDGIQVLDVAQKLVNDGADILDLGGESTRPKARGVPLKEELARVIPIVKLLAKKIKVPISIDTYKPRVAKQALDNGAVIVNDITGLRNPRMGRLVASYKAAVVIMHMRGSPLTMQKMAGYASLMDEIIDYLKVRLDLAEEQGIAKEKIIIDPGIGFAKSYEHNLEILRRLKELKVLGRPILVGPSRKSFIGKILDADPDKRLAGTVSACVLAAHNGAKIVRVHDVLEVKQALKVQEAVDKSC